MVIGYKWCNNDHLYKMIQMVDTDADGFSMIFQHVMFDYRRLLGFCGGQITFHVQTQS